MPRMQNYVRLSDDDSAEFLRVRWVARKLNITEKRVYQLIVEKRLVGVRFGPRQIRIVRDSVFDYIQQTLIDPETIEP